jgi:hypothetical protein
LFSSPKSDSVAFIAAGNKCHGPDLSILLVIWDHHR